VPELAPCAPPTRIACAVCAVGQLPSMLPMIQTTEVACPVTMQPALPRASRLPTILTSRQPSTVSEPVATSTACSAAGPGTRLSMIQWWSPTWLADVRFIGLWITSASLALIS